MTLFTINPNLSAVYRFASAVWTVPAATGIKEVRRLERVITAIRAGAAR